MHLAYVATFDPSVYVRCAPRAGCPRSGHHVFHGAPAAARAATCEFCSPLLPRLRPPVWLSRRRELACGRCIANSTRRLLPQPPMMPPSRPPLGDRTLAYTDRFPPTDDRSHGAEGDGCVFAGLLLRPYPSNSPAVVRKLAERRVRLWEAGDAVRAGFSEPRRARQVLDTPDLGMVSDAAAALPVFEALHPSFAPTDPKYCSPHEEPPDLRRVPPSWGGNADEVQWWGEDPRRVLRHAPRLPAGHVDWWRWEHKGDLDVPSWRMWVSRCLAGRCHSRTAAFLASGAVFALHNKDDPAAREERAKTGEPLRVRPLGVGSVLVRLASAHALVQVGADAREAMGPVQRKF
eukprot:jgi/Tetstr1/458393/TSEL_044831.t1